MIPLEEKTANEVSQKYLQPLLVDLMSLALNAKQTHWHVKGENFRSFHLELDEIVADARLWADTVAERAIQLGCTVEGQPIAVGKQTSLEPTPSGYIEVPDGVEITANQISQLIKNARGGLENLDKLDPVTQDFVIEICQVFEKHLWMLRAQFQN